MKARRLVGIEVLFGLFHIAKADRLLQLPAAEVIDCT
jgi:hypothetical protein